MFALLVLYSLDLRFNIMIAGVLQSRVAFV